MMNLLWPRRALATILLCAFASQGFAGNRSGTVTAQFLKLPTNARVVGLGGAQVAMARGAGSMGYNPAGMLDIERYAFVGNYTNWFADIQHSFIGAGAAIPGIGVVGLSVTMLATDDMPITTPGSPEGTGAYFRASEYAFGASFARRVSDEFTIGLTVKYIQSYLFNTVIGASSMAFDMGSLYHIRVLRTHLGVSLTNLGNDMTYIDEAYSLPTALRFGAATTVLDVGQHNLVTALQISRPNDADEQYNIGLEYIFDETFTLRAGYKFAYDAENFGAGMGVRLDFLGLNGSFDYGYNNFKWLPGTHSFSFEVHF